MSLYLPRRNHPDGGRRRVPLAARQEEDGTHPQLKKWAIRKMDEDKLTTVIQETAWSLEARDWTEMSVEQRALLIQRKMREICDYATPRSRASQRKSMYWWNAEIECLRKTCLEVRRKTQRARRRKTNSLQEKIITNQRYLNVAAEL